MWINRWQLKKSGTTTNMTFDDPTKCKTDTEQGKVTRAEETEKETTTKCIGITQGRIPKN